MTTSQTDGNAAVRVALVMAGGTGGHIFPGLAVAEVLRERGWKIVWLGTRSGMEAEIVPAQGYEMAFVRFSGLRGKGLLRIAMLPFNLLIAWWQCLCVILRVRPDVVLGMGGYISFPGGLVARMLARPLVLHEQNSIAGLANKVLARVANKVLVAFPQALKNAEWTGNPVRREIVVLSPPGERFRGRQGNLHLLVMGGSLGAQVLNETVPRALALLPAGSRPAVTHQAGSRHLRKLENAYRDAGVSATAVAFVRDMASAYGAADLVICRAGALTVSELAAAGVASVLVPYPLAVDDHQTHNARFLSERGAAILVPQIELTPRKLADLLLGFTRGKLLDMACRARELGKSDAAKVVAQHCAVAAG